MSFGKSTIRATKQSFQNGWQRCWGAADKKRIRELIKTDTVFKSQATQFVRSFDKVLSAAQQADNADKLAASLMKTDLGHIYIALKSHV